MTTTQTPVDALMALVDRYWELAYAEGKEGRDHDTEAGEAQAVLSEIRASARALAAIPEQQSERERFEAWYFDKYCAPIRKVSEGTHGGGRHYIYVEDERLFEVWCAALSHPSPQGSKG